MPGSVEASDDYLIVGRVRRSHGLRGDVLVAFDTDRPEHVFRTGKRLQLGDDRGDPTGRWLEIEGFRPTPGGAILKLAGLVAREDSDLLRGRTLLIAAAEALPAEPDEIHYRDLLGLSVISEGEAIGDVVDILEMPGAEMLVVRTSAGKEILIPFVKDIVLGFDLEARVLKVKLPDGMLDL